MQKTSKLNILLLTVICFFAFFIFGFTDNLKGPTLPPMIAELNIDYGTGGNIFFGEYLGFLIATLITGILADRFGLKVVMALAAVFLFLGVGGYSGLGTAALLGASLFVIGMGLGAFELGPNAIIVSLYHEQKGLYLNLMAVMHGLGSMLAPLFADWLFGLGVSWREVYRWDFLPIGILLLSTLILRFPKPEEKSSLDFRAVPQAAFGERLPLFYAAMTCYVAAEIGLASWLVVYLQDARAVSVSTSNQALALFFGMLMAGRLLGGFVVHQLGYLHSILLAALLAVLSLAAGIFTEMFIFIPVAGFFFSIIFPTLTAAVSDEHHKNLNTILGVLFTFSGLGGMLGPWLVAWAGDLFGLRIGFMATLLLAALTLLFTLLLFRMNRHGQSA
ncbi:MAG: hypothetical protein DPW18_09560 [Chloroflexi bacterium]|nr:hypothetical protein [Chloroflexota bacterium]MDL1941771.1 MFS transporter [Chloroflexi bacterium CFX2]